MIPIRSMTQAELDNRPIRDGYIGGRYTNFSGPDSVFMSWSTLFGSDAAAARAMTVYQHELESAEGWGLGAGTRTGLGDDGWRYTGSTTAFILPRTVEQVPSDVYIWRDGNLLLAVGGWFDYDDALLRTVAEEMDRRADALAVTAR